ncbi:hypothetical protein CUN59_09365 [Cuspidothrix issatschenkoi CHARLIE-1]|uniref:Uncharacterized protein n=1 Tax=Cuspidothrix issatschenkoi CHARLIE-1 TaxID=2052836 RepID=A0A2S6CUX8_9CYAN|nr:hypothetical protein CUN59_09365 [Cuspidothrix issatschenkoi CHARLIE-1]
MLKKLSVRRGNGNREQGTGNGEWGMGNGEWGIGNGEWGIGNREQETLRQAQCIPGNSFNYLDILNFSCPTRLDPTRKNPTVLRLHLPKRCTCLFLKSAKPLLINGYSFIQQPSCTKFDSIAVCSSMRNKRLLSDLY